MNRAYILIFAITVLLSCSEKPKKEVNEIEQILDTLTQTLTIKREIPSLAIGIVKDGKVVLAKGYGYANLEDSILANEHTIYQLGSITKLFTGRILAQQLTEGKMSLKDTLENHFSGTAFPKSPSGQVITVVDAATHSGEFPTYPANLGRTDPDPIKGYTREQMLEGIEMMVMDAPIGAQFYYSNFGYGVLATAIENNTGSSLQDLLSTNILAPLNMSKTSLFINDNIKDKLATPYLDVSPNVTTEPWEMGTLAGAGNMFSSVTDINKFMMALLEADTTNQIQQNKYFKIHDDWYYGLGCFIVDSKKYKTQNVFHGSDIDGYAGLVSLYPDHNLGFVILTNWGEGDVVKEGITQVQNTITKFYLGSDGAK